MNLGNMSPEEAYQKGKEDCAETHFKPDWEINAKMLLEAINEARRATAKDERHAVAKWLEEDCLEHQQSKPRHQCVLCLLVLRSRLPEGHAPTESGEWPE